MVRGILGFLSISGVYWSLKLLPLSDATVLQFIAPLFVSVLAPLILHENPSRYVLPQNSARPPGSVCTNLPSCIRVHIVCCYETLKACLIWFWLRKSIELALACASRLLPDTETT